MHHLEEANRFAWNATQEQHARMQQDRMDERDRADAMSQAVITSLRDLITENKNQRRDEASARAERGKIAPANTSLNSLPKLPSSKLMSLARSIVALKDYRLDLTSYIAPILQTAVDTLGAIWRLADEAHQYFIPKGEAPRP